MYPIIAPDATAVVFQVACLLITALAAAISYLLGAHY